MSQKERRIWKDRHFGFFVFCQQHWFCHFSYLLSSRFVLLSGLVVLSDFLCSTAMGTVGNTVFWMLKLTTRIVKITWRLDNSWTSQHTKQINCSAVDQEIWRKRSDTRQQNPWTPSKLPEWSEWCVAVVHDSVTVSLRKSCRHRARGIHMSPIIIRRILIKDFHLHA